jgi:hypothetical protein
MAIGLIARRIHMAAATNPAMPAHPHTHDCLKQLKLHVALLACRHEIYYDIHLQAEGQCGLPAENMHAQLGLCITGYGEISMSHARYTTHIKTTSAQLHGAGWSPHQFAVYPPFLLQAGHCGLPAENLHAQLGFAI